VLPGVALSLLTPVLVAVAFPPMGIWPAILVAFVPMLVAQHRVLPERWSGLGPAIGLGGMFGFHLSPGLVDGGLPVLAVLWPVLVAALVAPLFWRSRRFHEATGYRWFLVSAPVAWVALDFLRASANEVLAATFGYPSYALWDHPALLQPLSVVGINGLELLVLLVNWAGASLALAAVDRRRAADRGGPIVGLRRATIGGSIVAVLVVGWLVASVALLDDPAPTVTVAAVQTGVDRDADDSDERYRRDVEQTRVAAAQGAELVVWNEKGLGFDPRPDGATGHTRPERTAELVALARDTGVHLVIGFGFEDEEGRHHNEVTLLTPDGEFLGVYGKDHPGTFAGDFSDTGGTYPVYDTSLGPISTIICYDLDFTDTARHMARGGARLVATPSADVPSIGQVHFTHLVFRAIENRVAMVKADNEFDSAIIDPYGRVLRKVATSDGGLQATLVAAVPLGSGSSPWVSVGDWVGWATVGGAVVLVAGAWRTRRATSGSTPAG
jgi:apolipoprotein N-acyltransferase